MSEKSTEIVPAAVKSVGTVIEHEPDPAIAITADDDQHFVRDAATRIRMRLSRSIQDIIDIGHDLIAVKDKIGHGGFLKWIDSEFAMGEQTARNMMNAAQTFGKSPTVGDLSPTVLYELASPSTSPEVREIVETKAAAGAKITIADVKKLKAELTASRTAMAEIDQIKSKALRESDLLKSELRCKTDDMQKMEAEIKRLEDDLAWASDDGDGDDVETDTQAAMTNCLLIMGAIGTIIGQVKAESHAVFWAGFRGPIIGEWSSSYMKQQIEIAIGRLIALKAAIDQPPNVEHPPSKALLPAPNLDMPDIPAALRRAPLADAPPPA